MNLTFKYPEVIYPEQTVIDIYREAWQFAAENVEIPPREDWQTQLSCFPGSGNIWQWDSCLMTFFSRFSEGELPRMNNLDNLYTMQREDGYISMAYKIKERVHAYGERINPPLYAWAEWEYFLLSGDLSRFKRVYPVLKKYYDWIKLNRCAQPHNLYWFEDSGSSGMDNSPRSGYASKALRIGSDVNHVDLIAQQALSANYLARIAEKLGFADDIQYFKQEFEELKNRTNKYHWCERKGFYFDLFHASSASRMPNFVNSKTIAAFWTILSGIADNDQFEKLLAHLLNPDEFYTEHPIASLSKDDANYDPEGGYWLGAVWAPVNYMIIKGLIARGHYETARKIALKHISCMIKVRQSSEWPDIWECYSSEFMRPATTHALDKHLCRRHFVGWSGLGPISMLIEAVMGFSFNAPNSEISWRLMTEKTHGIKNLHFNDSHVSLIAEIESGSTKISVETDKAFTLKIFSKDTLREFNIDPGAKTFCL